MTVQRFNAVAVQGTFATHIPLRLTFSRASNFLWVLSVCNPARVVTLPPSPQCSIPNINVCVCVPSLLLELCVYYATLLLPLQRIQEPSVVYLVCHF